jgi:rsbT co-antagonist protein RsbR
MTKSTSTNGATQAELLELRRQVTELEQTLATAQAREQALEEHAARLQFIVDGSSDGAWDAHLTTGESFFSPRYAEMLGYRPDELAGRVETWQNMIHPDDAAMVNQMFQDYLEGRIKAYQLEHRLQHKSGEWRWFLSRGKVTSRDAQGNALRMTGTLTDITERRRAEEELRNFQALAEAAPDGIGVTDMEGRLFYANPSYRQLTGYGGAIVGMHLRDIYTEDQDYLNHAVQQTIEQGAWQGRLTVRRPDGEHVPLLVSAFMIKDSAGQPQALAGICRDLTDQLRAEEERLALQEQIIEAQRVALRELSTPLIPLAEGVVVMPLIGSMDSARAQQVMESLLEGVAVQRAGTAILDITGLQVVDTQVADALVRAARAVNLLGARVMITGIRPEVAQTLVGMGADLSSIQTLGSLQAGIAYALGHR